MAIPSTLPPPTAPNTSSGSLNDLSPDDLAKIQQMIVQMGGNLCFQQMMQFKSMMDSYQQFNDQAGH